MRLTLAQLRKLPMPYHCHECLNLKEQLEHFEDIISVSDAVIDYEIKERGIDAYLVQFHFEIDLILECAVTLKEVPYHIAADAEELFTTDESDEEAFMISNQTLDTTEAVVTNILIQKPMKVVAEGVEFENDEEDDEPDDGINPAFAKLKDLL